MNDTLALCLEILFWFALFVVFYTYLGYGILLYILVKLKELFVKPVKRSLPTTDGELPEVTLFITAFNEEEVVDEKMENCLELDYPADKLHIVWVTDGSDDGTNERLQTRWQGKATVHFQPLRQGKNGCNDARNDACRHSVRCLHGRQYDGEPGSDTGDCTRLSGSESGMRGGRETDCRADEGRGCRRWRRDLLEV